MSAPLRPVRYGPGAEGAPQPLTEDEMTTEERLAEEEERDLAETRARVRRIASHDYGLDVIVRQAMADNPGATDAALYSIACNIRARE